MAKFYLISDLHLDFCADGGECIIQSLVIPPDISAVCVAGDLCEIQFLDSFYKTLDLLRKYIPYEIPIIHVPGNHEFYGSEPKFVWNLLKNVEKWDNYNYHVLDNSGMKIDGTSIWGGTMWFPYQEDNVVYHKNMSDFDQIRGFVPWVYEQYEKFRKKAFTIPEGSVILTHHSPHICSSEPRFFNSPLNRFFVAPQWDLIVDRKPKVWMHGHVHSRADNVIEGCRVVCNACGYYYEVPDDYQGVVVEV